MTMSLLKRSVIPASVIFYLSEVINENLNKIKCETRKENKCDDSTLTCALQDQSHSSLNTTHERDNPKCKGGV